MSYAALCCFRGTSLARVPVTFRWCIHESQAELRAVTTCCGAAPPVLPVSPCTVHGAWTLVADFLLQGFVASWTRLPVFVCFGCDFACPPRVAIIPTGLAALAPVRPVRGLAVSRAIFIQTLFSFVQRPVASFTASFSLLFDNSDAIACALSTGSRAQAPVCPLVKLAVYRTLFNVARSVLQRDITWKSSVLGFIQNCSRSHLLTSTAASTAETPQRPYVQGTVNRALGVYTRILVSGFVAVGVDRSLFNLSVPSGQANSA
mmetsp:Transcript_102265/g.181577  ORF Transcript_102265/g.181577 Transcript_102265/m.181577 type:complete len:261 (-) Transcript_102265:567-1349(-)